MDIIIILGVVIFGLLALLHHYSLMAQKRETAIMNVIVALHELESGNDEALSEACQECLSVISDEAIEDIQNIMKNK